MTWNKALWKRYLFNWKYELIYIVIFKETPVSEKSVKYRRYVVKISTNYRKVQTASDGKFYEVLADSKNIMVKEK